MYAKEINVTIIDRVTERDGNVERKWPGVHIGQFSYIREKHLVRASPKKHHVRLPSNGNITSIP